MCSGLVFLGLGWLEEPLAVVGRLYIPSFLAEIFFPVDEVKTSDGLSGYDKFMFSGENLDSAPGWLPYLKTFLRREVMMSVLRKEL